MAYSGQVSYALRCGILLDVYFRDIQEKMKKAVEDGKLSKITKKNPVIISAQESLNKFSSSLNSIASEVSLTKMLFM